MLKEPFVRSFTQRALSPDPDIATAALMIARIEYPRLDAGPYLDRLDAMGAEAKLRVEAAPASSVDAPPRCDPDDYAHVMALNSYVFGELHFVGNSVTYKDPRNSFLNEVLDRRTGIPITLALVYMEVARRAGVNIEGVNFPGHFLLRCRARRGFPGLPQTDDLIIDAFNGGALLSEEACRKGLRRHGGDEAALESPLLVHATKPQILARMLLNLKLLYREMHSFPQALDVTDLLRAIDPSALHELRDRGLLAYHLKDFSGALRDLQAYLEAPASAPLGEEDRAEHAEIWEHVKTLRRRVAALN
jgi:regulator of sirC expression with transglutaminase-like and TPR domain